MNSILQTIGAINQPANSKLRGAESSYQLAISAFGVDSAEAQAAYCYWQALRRKLQLDIRAGLSRQSLCPRPA